MVKEIICLTEVDSKTFERDVRKAEAVLKETLKDFEKLVKPMKSENPQVRFMLFETVLRNIISNFNLPIYSVKGVLAQVNHELSAGLGVVNGPSTVNTERSYLG